MVKADNLSKLRVEGFSACALKILNKYKGHLLSVEAEKKIDSGLFYEFDVYLKKEKKEIEVECDPKKIKLSDFEEEVEYEDPRFANNIKISRDQAKKIALLEVKGVVVDQEYSLEKGKPIYEFDILDTKKKLSLKLK